MTFDVDVLEADIVWLRPGAPARVRIPAFGEQWLSGRVANVNPRVEQDLGTGRATILIDNHDRTLMSGLFTFVELEIRRLDNRLAVPVDAVLLRQGKELVFRIEDGRAMWTYVVTGSRSGDRVEIVQGLDDGDRVAVSGHFALAHEAPVAITRENATPAHAIESAEVGTWNARLAH